MFVRYSIACKEARETHDWLRRLAESEVLPTERPAPDYASVLRVDRDSHQHCQKDTRSGPCLNFPLHISHFKLSLPVDEHFARSLDELKTLESQARNPKKNVAGHSEPKQSAAKKPKGQTRSDN